MTAAGELNRRLALQAPVEMPDGAGGVTRSYADVATVWAKLVPFAARGQVVAAASGATITHRIVMRLRSDVTTRHRLRLGARVFRIATVREQEPGFLLVHAEERAD
jgi:SPP1 family predicted phage head-tail adaptor